VKRVRLTIFLLLAATATAQTFDVASIRPAAVALGREGGNRARIEHTPNSLTMWNVDVTMCVQWAYDLQPFQISAEHVKPESYDILAKTGDGVPLSQLRIMLRNLLADRFKLALHRETRMVTVYDLVVAKGGPKLTSADADPWRPRVHSIESLPVVQADSFLFRNASMADFARMLSMLRGIELPVVDRTGIAGNFDIELKSAPRATREADTGALLAILQEQTGLKLVSSKAPFEVIVLDHAEKPSEN
jgi:uncharacterized protein (TIGR03435 family)